MKKIDLDVLRKNWPILLAIVISLSVACYAYRQIAPTIYEKEAFTQSLVAASDLKPFTRITASDLTSKRVLKTSLPKDAIQNPDIIIGKVTSTGIKAGEPIYANQLDVLDKYKNKQFISVSVDLPRCVGGTLRPGDIVDAYWIDSVENHMWHQVGSNAIIVDILDSSGNTVNILKSSTGIETKSITPTLAILAVDKEQINPLIGAATGEKLCLVLVKKLSLDNSAVAVMPATEGGQKIDETSQTANNTRTNGY